MPEVTHYSDDHFQDLFASQADQTRQAVDLLAEFSGAGRVLELGVGAGRIAIPLARRGYSVVGIEASEKIVEVLGEKRSAGAVQVILGDIPEVSWGARPYDLVYAPFGIWEVLGTQERQLTTLSKAASALVPDGHLVIEGYVPEPNRFGRSNQTVDVRYASQEKVVLLVAQHDPVCQDINSYFVLLRNGKEVEILGEPKHYMHLRELDLEAESRGLQLISRWGGWSKERYEGGSRHISVYRKSCSETSR